MTSRSPKRRVIGVPNIKALITAASLSVTLGGWAALTDKENANQATASAPTEVPTTPAKLRAPSFDLVPLPTIIPPPPPPPEVVVGDPPKIPDLSPVQHSVPQARSLPQAQSLPQARRVPNVRAIVPQVPQAAPAALPPAPVAPPPAPVAPPAPVIIQPAPAAPPPPLRVVSAPPPRPVTSTRSSRP